VRDGLAPGQSRTYVEALADLTETAAGLPLDGIWALVATLEHAARRWMTEFMEADEQSVGTRVTIELALPRPPVARVRTTVTLREVRGRRFSFDAVLHNEQGEALAAGSNERALIAIPAPE
jgi:predicted thioesterase